MKTKTLIVTLICIVLTYFIIGYFLTRQKLMSFDFYGLSVSIISSVASLVSLISLIKPDIWGADINNVPTSLLKNISKNLNTLSGLKSELEDTQTKLSEKEKNLIQLDIKKLEMETLIKKISLIVFLN